METKSNTVAVRAKGLPVSTKMSIEVCDNIRHKNLSTARRILNDVLSMKRALPIGRFNHDLCHKPGMAAGRYPLSTASHFLKLVNSLEKNAENKGLNTKNLVITFAKADRGERRIKASRRGRACAKNTHIELHAEERSSEKK